MSTQKMTGPFGADYAVPVGYGRQPAKPPKRQPIVPPPSPEDWGVYPFYPPYPEVEPEPVPTPPIPGKHGHAPIPVYPVPGPAPAPAPQPYPPYPMPKPEKVDESSKKLAKLSAKAKVLVQMINDFEKKNKPAILTIGHNSYQFGTKMVTDGEGMYAELICTEDAIDLTTDDYKVVDDTRVIISGDDVPKDLLQTELARIRQEIVLVSEQLKNEVADDDSDTPTTVMGTDEE